MNTIFYDGCVIAGIAAVTVGAVMTFGVGVGLMVGGALLVVVPYATALVTRAA